MATEVPAVAVAGAPATGHVESKGLKKDAIGYISNIVISTASVAPAYSIAATLGFIIADPGVASHAPGVLLAAFVPMLLISLAYRYLNMGDVNTSIINCASSGCMTSGPRAFYTMQNFDSQDIKFGMRWMLQPEQQQPAYMPPLVRKG